MCSSRKAAENEVAKEKKSSYPLEESSRVLLEVRDDDMSAGS